MSSVLSLFSFHNMRTVQRFLFNWTNHFTSHARLMPPTNNRCHITTTPFLELPNWHVTTRSYRQIIVWHIHWHFRNVHLRGGLWSFGKQRCATRSVTTAISKHCWHTWHYSPDDASSRSSDPSSRQHQYLRFPSQNVHISPNGTFTSISDFTVINWYIIFIISDNPIDQSLTCSSQTRPATLSRLLTTSYLLFWHVHAPHKQVLSSVQRSDV